MKNFILAILIAIVLTKVLGGVASDWFDLHLVMGDELVSGTLEWIIMAGVVVLLVVIGFVVAMSIAAALGIAAVAILGSLVFAGIGIFWPVLLIVGAVLLLGRSNRAAA
ncbi:hypothetical protein [Alteromonas lipolytica]|uniref:Uncharacterized protein n=1 Tax=Alteromonas lipolytica TaxID=1856405 RepID=A0A1E8FC92_9ALTE|nr:hypothetical protein [Alteromonas lipolytica]OFI33544.1 hypothetical protein BFC17_04615 [Alteromonas lipolytica]GGF58782.1 hypothetical protein GCM10011338_08770 [Alteromonas lipolytica]